MRWPHRVAGPRGESSRPEQSPRRKAWRTAVAVEQRGQVDQVDQDQFQAAQPFGDMIMAAKADTVRPTERVDMFISPEFGNAKRKIELPFVQVVIADVLGNAGTHEDKYAVRRAIEIDEEKIDGVMKELGIALKLSIRDPGHPDQRPVEETIKIEKMVDFEPDSLIKQLDSTKPLVEAKEQLLELRRNFATGKLQPDELERKMAELLERLRSNAS